MELSYVDCMSVWQSILQVPILSVVTATYTTVYQPMRNHDPNLDWNCFQVNPSKRQQVIEFGYVTLFASAFPLAAAMSVISSWALWNSCYYSIEAFGMPLTMP